MTTEIPSDLVPFVQRMVSEKRFLNESDVLAEGLRLLQARETLHAEARKGFDQLDAGKGLFQPKLSTNVRKSEFAKLKMAKANGNGKRYLRTGGGRRFIRHC